MFGQALGLTILITKNSEEFNANTGCKINYSEIETNARLQIVPVPLLFDYGIKDYQIEVKSNEEFKKIFFKTSSNKIPFDLLAASFWLLTRYEEYLPFKSDKLGRYHYSSSIAYQFNFLEIPLINLWLYQLKQLLLQEFPNLEITNPSYKFLSSIDIDNAYKYKHKGFVRTLAGYLSDIKNKISLTARTQVISSNKPDPFDCYDFLIKAHLDNNTESIYFFLLGDYGPNDKNHSATHLKFQSLIKHIADYAMVGLHPSFGSNNKMHQLKVELSRLTNITHKTIRKSRQHFSMLSFPETYQQLVLAAITEDYSMGYTNKNGFRASYCLPYKWYNLTEEQTTSLTVYPFCISEVTLFYEAKLQNKQPIELAEFIINQNRYYNGYCLSIFHNDNFDEKTKNFFIEFLKLAK